MSGPRFHAGQLVEIVSARSFPTLLWRLFELAGEPRLFIGMWCWRVPDSCGAEVGLSSGDQLLAEEFILRPIYDGDQPSTWDECAWRPSEEPVDGISAFVKSTLLQLQYRRTI